MAAVDRTVVVLGDGPVSQYHSLAVSLGLAIDDLLDLRPRPIGGLRSTGRTGDDRLTSASPLQLVCQASAHSLRVYVRVGEDLSSACIPPVFAEVRHLRPGAARARGPDSSSKRPLVDRQLRRPRRPTATNSDKTAPAPTARLHGGDTERPTVR
jgi:hypothetical protein